LLNIKATSINVLKHMHFPYARLVHHRERNLATAPLLALRHELVRCSPRVQCSSCLLQSSFRLASSCRIYFHSETLLDTQQPKFLTCQETSSIWFRFGGGGRPCFCFWEGKNISRYRAEVQGSSQRA